MRHVASSASQAPSSTKQRPLWPPCLQACAPAHPLHRALGAEKATSLTHITVGLRPPSWITRPSKDQPLL